MIGFFKKTPLFRQINPIECGAVCLRIILAFYGIKKSQRELNERVGIASEGSDAQSLIKAAQSLGIVAHAQRRRAFELEASHKTPSIVFFDGCHFVVLEGYRFKKFFINDPAKGRYQLSKTEFHRRFSGIQITFEVPAKVSPSLAIRPTSDWLLGVFLGLLLGAGTAALSQALVSIKNSWWAISVGCFCILLFFALKSIYFLWQRQKNLSQEHQWQRNFINKIEQLSSSFFETRPFDSVSQALSASPVYQRKDYALGIVAGICLIELTIWQSYALLLIMMVTFWQLLPSIVTRLNLPSSSKLWLHVSLLDTMGQKKVALERAFLENYDFGTQYYLLARRKVVRSLLFFVLIIGLLMVIALWGQRLSVNGALSKSAVLASFALTLAAFFYVPLYRAEKEHDAHADLSDELDSYRKKIPMPLEDQKAILSLSFPHFFLAKRQEPLFEACDITLESGKLYGVVGDKDSGVANVLRIIGQKIDVPDMRFLQRYNGEEPCRVALIDDDADIFKGTLLENVRVFDEHISEHRVLEALINAGIEELFYSRPMGLLSPILEHGSTISGGQKKRLLLARALVQKPDLLVLDNFFDSLDQQARHAIFHRLKAQGITVVYSSSNSQDLALSDGVIFVHEKKWLVASHQEHLDKSTYRALLIDREQL